MSGAINFKTCAWEDIFGFEAKNRKLNHNWFLFVKCLQYCVSKMSLSWDFGCHMAI